MTTRLLDILVIGAAQAGLAMGYHLRRTPYPFQLTDGHARVGDVWRNRYDSLTLFTPRSYSALPGLTLAGDPQGYATRDEFADYLEAYAHRFDLPVATGTRVRGLDRVDGRFRATTEGGDSIEARAVVLATGTFQSPVVPALASGLSPGVLQLTPATYRSPAQIPMGATVVVVGDGATGRDIASDLASGRAIYLATGKPRTTMRERILGQSVFWWLDKIGALTAAPKTLLGGYLKKTDGFPARGKELSDLRRRGIRITPRVTRAEGERVTFANGESVTAGAVVWAAGYRDDSAWVNIPEVKDANGAFIHRHGIAPVPGLFFIGRPWQRSRASGLVAGVGSDAEFIVGHLTRFLDGPGPAR
jgi:putative flavoprotein involved in K+ transport